MANKEINNNGFDFIDLELPSGTLWSTKNVGASKPSESGLYFQWGDVQGYTKEQFGKDKHFSWDDYKWNANDDKKDFTKYTTKSATLNLEDDAAHAYMGGSWHIPSPEQIQELIDNTTNEWTKQNDVKGILFVSKKDSSKTLFIPTAGIVWDDFIYNGDSYAGFWASMLSTKSIVCAQLCIYARLDYVSRCCGIPIRGVIG